MSDEVKLTWGKTEHDLSERWPKDAGGKNEQPAFLTRVMDTNAEADMLCSMLRAYGKSGTAPAKFLEVMACEGGCITGPCVHNELRAGKRKFEKELGKETKTYDDMD